MGLFSLLKNGFTIEKKKVETNSETETENDENELIDDTAEASEPVAVTPEPATMTAQPTIEDQRLEAASVLLGDNGLTGGSTPSLIQVTQPQATPITQASTATQTPGTNPMQVEAPNPQPQIFNAHNNHSFDNALLGQVSANQNLLVIAPQTSAEISTILTNLANGNACIVSLSKFALPDAQRFLDYICGFVNAIGGMIMQKTSTEYILAPKGVNIKNS